MSSYIGAPRLEWAKVALSSMMFLDVLTVQLSLKLGGSDQVGHLRRYRHRYVPGNLDMSQIESHT